MSRLSDGSTAAARRNYPTTKPIVVAASESAAASSGTATPLMREHSHREHGAEDHPQRRSPSASAHSVECTGTTLFGTPSWHTRPVDDDIVAVISEDSVPHPAPVRNASSRVRQWVREPIRASPPSRTRPPPPVYEPRNIVRETVYWQLASGAHGAGYGRSASPTNLDQRGPQPSTQVATPSRQERSAVAMDLLSNWNGRVASTSRPLEGNFGNATPPSNATRKALGVALDVLSGTRQNLLSLSPTPDRRRQAASEAHSATLEEDCDSCMSPAPSPIYYAPIATPRPQQQHTVLHYDRRSLPNNRGSGWSIPQTLHNDDHSDMR